MMPLLASSMKHRLPRGSGEREATSSHEKTGGSGKCGGGEGGESGSGDGAAIEMGS